MICRFVDLICMPRYRFVIGPRPRHVASPVLRGEPGWFLSHGDGRAWDDRSMKIAIIGTDGVPLPLKRAVIAVARLHEERHHV